MCEDDEYWVFNILEVEEKEESEGEEGGVHPLL
jgi:hypothetical protein